MATRYPGKELEIFRDALNWKHYVAGMVAPFIRGRVLEVGAGIGAFTAMLFNARCSTWLCLEPDAGLALEASAGVHARGLSGSVRVAAGTLACVRERADYDAILYLDVLEHIADDGAEIDRAARLLAPAGRLIILAPAHRWLYSPFDRAIGHHRRYSAAELAAAVPSPLAVERLVYLDSLGVLLSAGNRLLLRSSVPSRAQINFWDRAVVPVSRIADRLLGHRLGKSVLGVWRMPG